VIGAARSTVGALILQATSNSARSILRTWSRPSWPSRRLKRFASSCTLRGQACAMPSE
jgi:hypothetical protein